MGYNRFDQRPETGGGGAFGREEEVGQTARKKTGFLYLTRCNSRSGCSEDAALQSRARAGSGCCAVLRRCPAPNLKPHLPSTRPPDRLFGGGEQWTDWQKLRPMETCSGSWSRRTERWGGKRWRPVNRGAARPGWGLSAVLLQAAGLEAVVVRLGLM